MDKESFGRFVAERRREKNLTQKELADRLVVSDKAVSKWERGLSFPDITLLEPMASVLEVSITELMEGRRIDMKEQFNASEMEEAVQKTMELNREESERESRSRRGERFLIALCFTMCAAAECLYLCKTLDVARVGTHLFLTEGMAVVFGFYAWVFMVEKLPQFFDENKINQYSNGFFRMNIPGLTFNNSNWKHIVKVIRLWAVLTAVFYPVLVYLEETFLMLDHWVTFVFIGIVVTTLLVPIYVVGLKYK